MRLGGVAGAAALPHDLAGGDVLARPDPDRALPQVGEQQDRAPGGDLEDDTVAGERDVAPSGPARLGQRIGHERELRAPRRVVLLGVVDREDPPGDRGEDRGAEADEDLRGLGREHAAPRPRSATTPGVDGDEVDRMARAEERRAVTRNPPSRAHLGAPPAAEGEVEHHRVHGPTLGPCTKGPPHASGGQKCHVLHQEAPLWTAQATAATSAGSISAAVPRTRWWHMSEISVSSGLTSMTVAPSARAIAG